MGENRSIIYDDTLLREDFRGHQPAFNLDFNEKIRKLREGGQQVYHFGFGQSPFPVMPQLVSALAEFAHENSYLSVVGIPELRKAIVDLHQRYDNISLDKESVVVGPGSKELIFLLMTVFNGDILVVNPAWPTYKPQAHQARKQCHLIEARMEDDWKLTSESIEKAISYQKMSEGPKLLIFCNPDNPTGAAYNMEDLSALADTFRRQNILVLSDEIYGRLHYEDKHITLTKIYPEGTILSSGFSKWTSLGGWRVGYHIFPPELYMLRDAVRSAASHTYSCAPSPMQYAIAKCLNQVEDCNSYIKHTTRIMKAVGEYCHRDLTSIGVKCVKPKAGYYCFPNFEAYRAAFAKRGIHTGVQMCDAMLKECHVALMAGGPAFLRPVDEFTVRFCYVNFDGALALAASMQIGLDNTLPDDFVQSKAVAVHEGVQALKQWLLKQRES